MAPCAGAAALVSVVAEALEEADEVGVLLAETAAEAVGVLEPVAVAELAAAPEPAAAPELEAGLEPVAVGVDVKVTPTAAHSS